MDAKLREARAFLAAERRERERRERAAPVARVDLGPPCGVPPREAAKADAYFQLNYELSVWLAVTRGVYFTDLGSDEARRIFADEFLPEYNTGRLPAALYGGVSDAMGRAARTEAAWRRWAEAHAAGGGASGGGGVMGPAVGPPRAGQTVAEAYAVRSDERRGVRERERAEARAHRHEERARLDELAPRADGGTFAARAEKAAGRREARAARDADATGLHSAGVDELGGSGGGDSFRAALSRRNAAGERRAGRQEARREHAQGLLAKQSAKEDGVMAEMRALAAQAAARGGIAKRPAPQ